MPSQQTLQLSVKGLHTYSSELSGVPSGSLIVADNISINRLNLIEPRRGFNHYATGLATDERAYSLFNYRDYLWAHTSTKLYVDNSGWQDRGTISAPSGQKLRWAQANNNLYVATSNGIYKTDAVGTSLSLAGVQQAITFTAATTGSSGFLADTYYAAYRVVFGRKDANNNLVLGGVSQKIIVRNNAGGSATRDVSITIEIPSGIAIGDFVQVYRTKQTDSEPGEEYQQCYEAVLASTSALTFTDNCTDDLLGGFLYTNPSQGSIANQHIALPFAKDLCFYKNHLVASNVRYRHFFNLTSISVGSSGANTFQNNDTIAFVRGATTITYTGKTSAPGANQFLISTAGSTSQNIRDTALALVTLVNSDSSNFLYAYYESGFGDLPGKILLEARDLTNTVFSVISSRGGAFNPILPSSGTNAFSTSSADAFTNGIAYSNYGEAEHFTDDGFDEVGRPDKAILRALPLRDAVIFLKEDGVFTMRGSNRNDFSITELDSRVLLAPECVCVANNTIFAYLDAGFAAITDSGVNIISTPIKDQLLDIQGPALAQIELYAHAIAYETEGKVYFYLPSTSLSTYADICFVYDYYNNTFVRQLVPARCGLVFDDKLILGSPTDNILLQERKTLTYTDYADYGDSLTISTDAGTTLTLSDTTGMEAGDLILQDGNYAYIETINNATNVITVDLDVAWDTGSPVEWLKAIPVEVCWNPEVAGNPAGYKAWQECLVIFKRTFLVSATLKFYTDLFTGRSEIEVTQPAGSGNFGDFDFGDATFGGQPSSAPVRVMTPRNASKSNLLYVTFEHRVAYSDFQLNGLSLTFRPISTRST